jgi:hypothetical protein
MSSIIPCRQPVQYNNWQQQLLWQMHIGIRYISSSNSNNNSKPRFMILLPERLRHHYIFHLHYHRWHDHDKAVVEVSIVYHHRYHHWHSLDKAVAEVLLVALGGDNRVEVPKTTNDLPKTVHHPMQNQHHHVLEHPMYDDVYLPCMYVLHRRVGDCTLLLQNKTKQNS